MATVEAWLAGHPDITVLSRDRGGGYGEAASKALPSAIQVADRWHLMENASSAFLSAVRKSMRPIRAAIGATTINPELLTCAERLQYEGYLRREDTIAIILALAKDGTAIKQIVRKTGHSRNRVRQVLRGDRGDVFRTRQSSLDAHLPLLDAQWAGGCRNGAKLWRRLKLDGFRGSQRVVSEWATRRRRAEKASDQQLQKVPSARTIARLMTTARDHMSKADTIAIAAIEAGVPTLVAARTLTDRFHIMVKQRTEADLVPWIAAASQSLIASFGWLFLRHHGDGFDFEQQFRSRELNDLHCGRSRWRLGVEVAVTHFPESRQLRDVDEIVGDLDHMLEAGAGRGQGGLEILETLHGLGAKIAADFSIGRYADLAGDVDGAARVGRFHDVRVAYRAMNGRRILKAMNGHPRVLPGQSDIPSA